MCVLLSAALKAETIVSTRTDSDYLNAVAARQLEVQTAKATPRTGTFVDSLGNNFAYTLTLPLNPVATQKYPLVVHSGDSWEMACPSWQADFPCYVLCVTRPSILNTPDPSISNSWKQIVANALKQAVDIARGKYPTIDDSKIFVFGYSKNGGSAWVAVYTYPDTFAAIVTSSATINDMSQLPLVARHKIGVWMTQAIQVEVPGLTANPKGSFAIRDELVRLGADPKFIEYDSDMAHRHATIYDTSTTTAAWKDFTALRTWLAAQKKTVMPQAPSIQPHPISRTVALGQTATFSMTASGSPAPSFQWYKSTDGGNTWTVISGATAASYTTRATVLANNNNLFRCTATNSSATATSNPALLTVNSAIGAISSPLNQKVSAGLPATFSITFTSTGGASTYQWQKSTDDGTTWADVTGATGLSYTKSTTVVSDDESKFRCVVTNTAGTAASGAGLLTVDPTAVLPTVVTQPANQSVVAGQPVTFNTVASGADLYQWKRSIDNGLTYLAIADANSASFTIPVTTATDNNNKFKCVLYNRAGLKGTTAATLTVTAAAMKPTITTQPANQSVVAGLTAKFTVAASGSPTPAYQWQKSTDSGVTWTNVVGATVASYTTPATILADNGTKFRCVATNSAGSATSNNATLTVSVTVAPAITSQPLNKSVTAGQAATFAIVASGTPAPTFQWQKSTDSGVTWANIVGATTSSYTTPATILTDNGSTFRCVATNSAGSATSNAATLAVNAASVAPAITSQPVNKSVTAGQTATFSVAASGTPAPTFQWQKSIDSGVTWANIIGATTASYITPMTTLADNGSKFRCVATNSAGSATSNAAMLTVSAANRPPVVDSAATANPNPVTAGQLASFFVAASDPDQDSLSYSWVFGDGATMSGSSVAHSYISEGIYTATVTISDGALSTTSSVTTTVNAAIDPSLAAYWKFDENSGSAAADASGHGNTGTLFNGPVWSAGKIGGCLRFNGSTTYIDCGNGASLNPGSQLSVAAWINMNAGSTSASQEILSKSSQYHFRVQAGGKLRFAVGSATLNGTSVLSTNTWHYVAATYDGAEMKLYVNGVLDGTLSNAALMSNNGLNVRLGARDSSTPLCFNGLLDEVRVYNRAISAAEIGSLKVASTSLATVPLILAAATVDTVIELGSVPVNQRFKLALIAPQSLVTSKVKRYKLADSNLPRGIRVSRGAIGGRALMEGEFTFSIKFGSKDGEVVQTYRLIVSANP
jgi:hypothetical protein